MVGQQNAYIATEGGFSVERGKKMQHRHEGTIRDRERAGDLHDEVLAIGPGAECGKVIRS